MLRAAWWLAQCWRQALVAARVLLGALARRPTMPSKSARPSMWPINFSAARAGGMTPLGAGDTSSRGGAQNKGCWRVQKVRVGELLQQPWSRSAMAQEWRAVVRGVHSARVCGACALAHSTHPFAGCMAGREDVARHEALKKTGPQ